MEAIMMEAPSHQTRVSDTKSLMWLLPAAALLFFSNGRWIVPAAAWWAPVFLLRFVRSQRPRVGLGAACAVSIVIPALTWKGIIPLHDWRYFLVTSFMGLMSFLPYALDRMGVSRLRGFASTLVFPMAWVAIEQLSVWTSPFGSWGSAAYTQAENLPLVQIVSVAGLPGLVFLMAWFASAVNGAWESDFEGPGARAGVLGYAALLAIVLLAGSARLALLPPRAATVRVASLTVKPARPVEIWRSGQGPLSDAEMTSIRRGAAALFDSLLERSRREARAGARIVVWSEGSAVCFKEDEPGLISRAGEFSRREGIYLFVALVTFTPGRPLHENQLLTFDPAGRLAIRYHKARPAPGDPETGADRSLPILASPFGRMGGAICYDMDFPDLVREQGRAGVDFMLVPSSDWKELDPLHTRMALVRGVENGCSVVRQTANGLSAAADYEGRLLATMDYFRTEDRVMVAQVPTRGVRTVYSRVGDLFAWMCIVGLFLALGAAARLPPR